MNPQADKFRFLPLLIMGIAVILFSTAGVAAIMGWLPASAEDSGETLALNDPPVALASPVAATGQTRPPQVGRATRTKGRCAECGMIVSMREIVGHDDDSGPGVASGATADKWDEAPVKSASSHEIIVRLADGSSRVINHASAASWRPGERVIVIDGANPSNR